MMSINMVLAILTCPDPACQHQQRAIMPGTYCQLTYKCEACAVIHVRKTGTCCVFCSYADIPCPSKQGEETCGPQCSKGQ